MSEQFELLDDIEEQATWRQNAGDGRPRRHRAMSVSPGILRAKVARAAPDPEPSPANVEPEAMPAPPVALEAPAVPRIVTTRDELLDLIRRRRDELGITHETIDHITGWASGYASKVLSPEPLKNLGPKSLFLVLEALALGIARVEFVEDAERATKMRSRWVQRLRPQMKPRRTRGALLAERQQQMLASTTEVNNDETPSKLPPEG